MKSLLQHPVYRWLTLANFISTLGDAFLGTCLAIYVMKTTGSVSLFASILALQSIPTIFLGPLAGALMDRFNKLAAVIFIDLLRGLFFIGLGLYAHNGHLTLPSIYTLVLFEAFMQSFYASAKTSILPTLLDRELLVQANMVNSTITQCSLIIGPALSVIVLGYSGIGMILLLNGLSFITACCFQSIRFSMYWIKFRPDLKKRLSFQPPFELYRNTEILSLTFNGILTHFAVLPFFATGLPYLLLKIYHLSDTQYGFMNSLAMAGTLLSALTVPLIHKQLNDLKALNIGMYGMLTAASLLFPLSIPIFHEYLATTPWTAFFYFCLILLLFHLSFSTYGVFYGSFYQKKVPTTHLGRFTSMLIAGFALGRVLGTQLYGWLFAHHLLLPATMVLFGGMLVKLALNYATPSSETLALEG